MSKKKHRHKFQFEEVQWKTFWTALEHGHPPKPCCIVLACRCGAIKLVPAKLVSGGRSVVRRYRELEGK